VFAIRLLPGSEQCDGDAGEPARQSEVQHLSLAVGALTETRARSLIANNVECSSVGRRGGKYHRSEQMPEITADDTGRTADQARETAAEEAAGSSLKKCPTIRTDRSAAMTSYRADFMNEFARNRQVHKVCQRSIVRSACGPEQVSVAAKTHFAKARRHSRLADSCRDDRSGAGRRRPGFRYRCACHGSTIGRKTNGCRERRMQRNSAQAQGALPTFAINVMPYQ
jgi:hypothetical protein